MTVLAGDRRLAIAERQHRDHAAIEQVFADWASGPLAHLPSGRLTASAAWLTLAAISHHLLRAAGCLASPRHARADGATIRADLVNIAARLARHGRGHLILHLPLAWHRQHEWISLFQACCGPPQARSAWAAQTRSRQPFTATSHPEPRPPAQEPGQAAEPVSGRTTLPA